MSLKQKVLGVIAGGLTLASLMGSPAYASYKDSKPPFGGRTSFAFGDVNGDGLTDMILGNENTVIYFKNEGRGSLEYEQRIYTPKNKEKPGIVLIRIKGKMQLIIITESEFKTYRVNDKGKFEECEFELEWIEDDDEFKY